MIGVTFFCGEAAKLCGGFARLGRDIVQLGLKAHLAAQAMPRRNSSRAGPWSITLA